MKEVVIVSACRTAIGAFGGTLKDSSAAVIGSVTMKEAIERAGIGLGHRLPNHGDSALRPEKQRQIDGPGDPLRWRRGIYGLCPGDDVRAVEKDDGRGISPWPSTCKTLFVL